MVSAGVDYKLNNKMHLCLEPACRYTLLTTRDFPVTERLWSAGLNVGIYFVHK